MFDHSRIITITAQEHKTHSDTRLQMYYIYSKQYSQCSESLRESFGQKNFEFYHPFQSDQDVLCFLSLIDQLLLDF